MKIVVFCRHVWFLGVVILIFGVLKSQNVVCFVVVCILFVIHYWGRLYSFVVIVWSWCCCCYLLVFCELLCLPENIILYSILWEAVSAVVVVVLIFFYKFSSKFYYCCDMFKISSLLVFFVVWGGHIVIRNEECPWHGQYY